MKAAHCAIAATALLVCASIDTAYAKSKYLTQIPNGESIGKEAGHTGEDVSAFGEAFKAAGHLWTPALCAKTDATFGMTYGQAFGDPCCIWKVGDTPDFPALKENGNFKLNSCAANEGGDDADAGAGDQASAVADAGTSVQAMARGSDTAAVSVAEVAQFNNHIEPAAVADLDDFSDDADSNTPPIARLADRVPARVPGPVPTATRRVECDVEDDSDDDGGDLGYGGSNTPAASLSAGYVGDISDFRRLRRE